MAVLRSGTLTARNVECPTDLVLTWHLIRNLCPTGIHLTDMIFKSGDAIDIHPDEYKHQSVIVNMHMQLWTYIKSVAFICLFIFFVLFVVVGDVEILICTCKHIICPVQHLYIVSHLIIKALNFPYLRGVFQNRIINNYILSTL